MLAAPVDRPKSASFGGGALVLKPHTRPMNIDEWWPKLKPSTRAWLIENNGDALPAEVVAEIASAGGPVSSDAWWVGQGGPSGLYMPDAAIDWIEAVANGEVPERGATDQGFGQA